MRFVADFVGGELDGRLEGIQELVPCICVPTLANPHMIFAPGMSGMMIEVTEQHYIRREEPSGMAGDVVIYVFELGEHEHDDTDD